MRQLILVWLAVALSIGACATTWQDEAPEPTLFELVCEKAYEEYKVTCSALMPPIVVTTRLLDGIPARGGHLGGEPYVFVHPEAASDDDGSTLESVEYHETVHYVLSNLGLRESRCQSEAVARAWTAEQFGVPESLFWRFLYGCDDSGFRIFFKR